MLLALPPWLDNLANDVAALWPLYLLVVAILGAARASTKVMTNAIRDVVGPVDSRLQGIEAEFMSNGGLTMRDRQDHMMVKLDRIMEMMAHHDVALDVLWETAPDALYVAGPEGTTVKANQAYLDLWGFHDASQLATTEWVEQLTPVAQELAHQRVEAMFFGDTHPEFTFDLDRADGRIFRVIGKPIMDNGTWQGYAGVVLDLGARTLADVDDHVTQVDDHVTKVEHDLEEHVMWEEQKYDEGGRKGQEPDDAE